MKIEIMNPWTREIVTKDISGLTQEQLDFYAQHIDDETLYDLEGVGETPEEWLFAYVDKVGPEEAGLVIIGS